MPMSEPPTADPAKSRSAREFSRAETPIVPRDSIAGRALIAVIAIMTFLASLTTGAVLLVRAAAGEWQADVTREVTVQVRPVSGRDLEADVNAAVGIIRGAAGIDGVRAYSKEESGRLLEPWLGQGLVLDDLPLPRLIVVRLAAGSRPDLQKLGRSLREVVPTASLDDHRGWVGRMRTMAGTAVFGGLLILALVIVATGLSVAFATRGAMAVNRPIIEVLHFIGARNRFIAGRFQRHFLRLGLQGGVIGGGAAILLFLIAQGLSAWFVGSAAEDQLGALFGRFSLGLLGYAALAGQILLVAAVTAATSRHTVNRTLDTVE
jgi:cell division transport system permease protein